jgi:hypothetical protein
LLATLAAAVTTLGGVGLLARPVAAAGLLVLVMAGASVADEVLRLSVGAGLAATFSLGATAGA